KRNRAACAIRICQNPKSESRNPKQIQNSKSEGSKRTARFGPSDFEFVSDFEIRISRFGFRDSDFEFLRTLYFSKQIISQQSVPKAEVWVVQIGVEYVAVEPAFDLLGADRVAARQLVVDLQPALAFVDPGVIREGLPFGEVRAVGPRRTAIRSRGRIRGA